MSRFYIGKLHKIPLPSHRVGCRKGMEIWLKLKQMSSSIPCPSPPPDSCCMGRGEWWLLLLLFTFGMYVVIVYKPAPSKPCNDVFFCDCPSFSWRTRDPIYTPFKRKCFVYHFVLVAIWSSIFSFINIDAPGLLAYLAADLLKLIFSSCGDLFLGCVSASHSALLSLILFSVFLRTC